ncbi:MAG: hypothetical protein GWO04_28115 [Actinobacteria bacterium]|nr:hypothetical protein [Actinomycetota bacterium]
MDPTEGLVLEARLPSGAIPNELRVAVLDPQGGALTSGNYATGERGRVRLASIPPGTWELLVSGPGSAVSAILAQSPGNALPVQLEPACNLEVTVPDLVGSGEVAQVSLVDSMGRPFRSLSWSGSPRSEWRMTGGNAEFASLPPDEWTVRVTAPDGRAWEGRSVTSPGQAASLIME